MVGLLFLWLQVMPHLLIFSSNMLVIIHFLHGCPVVLPPPALGPCQLPSSWAYFGLYWGPGVGYFHPKDRAKQLLWLAL